MKPGGFTIRVPGETKELKLPVKTPVGTVDVYTFVCVYSKDCTFMASYSDYPEAFMRNADGTNVLDGARDGAVRNIKGKLRSEKKITLNPYPGREPVVDEPSGASVKCRIYLVKNRLYQEVATVPRGQETNASITYSLDSFKLIVKCPELSHGRGEDGGFSSFATA